MADIKYTLIFLHLMALIAVAQTASRFFVTEKQVASLGQIYGGQAVNRLNSLLELMDGLVASAEEKKVVAVNRFFNQLEFGSDMQTWKKKDYWASRLEFLGKGQGDCEDFAVAKFLTMTQLGIPEKKLFLTYVKAVGYPEAAHLVVTYYREPNSIPFVLDNYNKKILPATQRKDLIPVYSFTGNDLYLQKQQGLGRRVTRAPLRTQKSLKAIDMEIRERDR